MGELEARVGIEPTYKGFADLSLTTWVPRREQWSVAGGHSPATAATYKDAPKAGRTQKAFVVLRGEKIWSGRRDLNPRLRPWQGRTLPLSYSRSAPLIINNPQFRGNGAQIQHCIVSGARHLVSGAGRLMMARQTADA